MPKKNISQEKFPAKMTELIARMKEVEKIGGTILIAVGAQKNGKPKISFVRHKTTWQWSAAELTDALGYLLNHQAPANHANSIVACFGSLADKYIVRMNAEREEAERAATPPSKKVWKKPSRPAKTSPKK